MKLSSTTLYLAISLATGALGETYTRTENIIGDGFFDAFDVQNIPDPTHGRVNYVNAEDAKSKNLTVASGSSFILRADDTSVLSPSGPGRDSVRIRTKNEYTVHVAVFDILHAPAGCGSWPAIWTVNEAAWPNSGEVDIMEGVNDQARNHATLHTSAGCTMAGQGRNQTGISVANNCDVAVDGNAGCGVQIQDDASYGPPFNKNKGGWYAMERTTTDISVWFWPRDSTTVPAEISNGTEIIDTASWGVPSAHFSNDTCDIAQKFGKHHIIINLTFCGDWAGQQTLYAGAGCPSTCVDHVNLNPSAFSEAYWEFAAMRVYQVEGGNKTEKVEVEKRHKRRTGGHLHF